MNSTMSEREQRAAKIIDMYETASTMSNTRAIEAGKLLAQARELEEEYWAEYWSEADGDEALMPASYYVDVIPIIRSRQAAARAGQDS